MSAPRALTRRAAALVGAICQVLACWSVLAIGALCEAPLFACFSICCLLTLPGPRRFSWAPGAAWRARWAALAGATLLGALACRWALLGPGAPGGDPPAASDLAAVVLLAPLFEERLYRGVLLRELVGCVGVPAAVVLTAALFAASHLTWPAIPWTFAAGLLLGGLRAAGADLTTLVGLHAWANASLNVVRGPYFPFFPLMTGEH